MTVEASDLMQLHVTDDIIGREHQELSTGTEQASQISYLFFSIFNPYCPFESNGQPIPPKCPSFAETVLTFDQNSPVSLFTP